MAALKDERDNFKPGSYFCHDAVPCQIKENKVVEAYAVNGTNSVMISTRNNLANVFIILVSFHSGCCSCKSSM